jgi:hypothetical protein
MAPHPSTTAIMSSSDPIAPESGLRKSTTQRAPRIQSRETGDVAPEAALSFAKSWNHFIAGG